jgi:hypothetical protein
MANELNGIFPESAVVFARELMRKFEKFLREAAPILSKAPEARKKVAHGETVG